MNSVTRNEVNDFFYDNLKHWMDDDVWMSVALIDQDRTPLARYVKDNPYFRNRLTVYSGVFNKHYYQLKRYKDEGTKLAGEINTFLENEPIPIQR